MAKHPDACEFPRCRQLSDLTYYGRRLCNRCHSKYDPDELKRALRIEEPPAGPLCSVCRRPQDLREDGSVIHHEHACE